MAGRAALLTASEVLALVRRAAMGAGLDVGRGEALARAAVSSGALGEVAAALTDLPDERAVGQVVPAARIALVGPGACDLARAGLGPVVLQMPDAPRVMVAMAALASGHGSGCRAVRLPAGLRVEAAPEGRPSAPVCGRIAVSGEVLERLDSLAARSCVPATDASRSGAGQGA